MLHLPLLSNSGFHTLRTEEQDYRSCSSYEGQLAEVSCIEIRVPEAWFVLF